MRLLLLAVLGCAPLAAQGAVFDIRDHGARPGEDRVNTQAVQGAIDACTAAGGGTVLVTGGRFVTGTIYLKDNVTLHIAGDAALLGSTDPGDYAADTHKIVYANESYMDRCLLFARNARNVCIEGRGTIDGRGQVENFPNTGGAQRPMLIRFLECERVLLRDVRLVNPASWTCAFLYCDDVAASNLSIHSRANWNGDGLDFDGCRNVRVHGCSFDTSDDSVCLQASRADRPCRDITVSDCVFVSKWAGMRIGMSSLGDFENVAVSNCVFRDISDAGLKIQMCEGGAMRNMVFSNLVMQNVPRPVLMTFNRFRLGVDTPDPAPPMRSMGRMRFSNLLVDNSALEGVPCGIVLSGVPGHPIEDIAFSNVSLLLPGGGAAEDAAVTSLPGFTDQRPEFHVLGEKMPFAGLFARHVRGLRLDDVRFDAARPDARPVIVCEDVEGLVLRGVDYGDALTGPGFARAGSARVSWGESDPDQGVFPHAPPSPY